MLLYRTESGVGYNPLALYHKNSNSKNTRHIYLFMLDKHSKFHSAAMCAIVVILSACFLLGSKGVPPGAGFRYIVASCITLTGVFIFRSFRKSVKFQVADIEVIGTAPMIFAFEWFSVFGGIALNYLFLSATFGIPLGVLPEICLSALLIIAFVPFIILGLNGYELRTRSDSN